MLKLHQIQFILGSALDTSEGNQRAATNSAVDIRETACGREEGKRNTGWKAGEKEERKSQKWRTAEKAMRNA